MQFNPFYCATSDVNQSLCFKRRCARNLRTTDGQPVCNCCLRVGHVAKYCRNRCYVLSLDQVAKPKAHKFNAICTSQEEMRQIEDGPQFDETLFVNSPDLTTVSNLEIQSQEPSHLLRCRTEEFDVYLINWTKLGRRSRVLMRRDVEECRRRRFYNSC